MLIMVSPIQEEIWTPKSPHTDMSLNGTNSTLKVEFPVLELA
jgi:hypothetical protein